jgi:hypothetical protein
MSLRGLTEIIAASSALQALAEDIRLGRAPHSLGLPRAARPFVLAALARYLRRPILYVTSSVESSRVMTDALGNLSDAPVLHFAEPNTAFYDSVAPVREVIAQRSVALAALAGSADGTPPLIVASPRALMHPVPSATAFKLHTRIIRRDATLNLEAMLAHWVAIGYESAPVVERIGTFSRRGGIVDVWSPVHPLPARIELFGNVADSIRAFDPGTQRSSAALDRVVITPLDMEIRDWRLEIDGESPISNLQSLLDHLDDRALLVIDDEEALRDAWRGLEEKAERERETLAESGLPVDERLPYLTWEEFTTAKARVQTLVLGQSEAGMLSAHPLAAQFALPEDAARRGQPHPHGRGLAPGRPAGRAVVGALSGHRRADRPGRATGRRAHLRQRRAARRLHLGRGRRKGRPADRRRDLRLRAAGVVPAHAGAQVRAGAGLRRLATGRCRRSRGLRHRPLPRPGPPHRQHRHGRSPRGGRARVSAAGIRRR